MSSAQLIDIYEAPTAELHDVLNESQSPEANTGLFSFKGRLSVLAYMARTSICMLILMAWAGSFVVAEESGLIDNGIVLTVCIILLVPVLWVASALTAKRLHDMSRSGWNLLFTLVPVIGNIYWLYIALSPGNAEPNKYGYQTQLKKWEKPVGTIGMVLLVCLMLFDLVAGIADALSSF